MMTATLRPEVQAALGRLRAGQVWLANTWRELLAFRPLC